MKSNNNYHSNNFNKDNISVNDIDLNWKYEDDYFNNIDNIKMKDWKGIDRRILYYINKNTILPTNNYTYITNYVRDIVIIFIVLISIILILGLIQISIIGYYNNITDNSNFDNISSSEYNMNNSIKTYNTVELINDNGTVNATVVYSDNVKELKMIYMNDNGKIESIQPFSSITDDNGTINIGRSSYKVKFVLNNGSEFTLRQGEKRSYINK